MEFEKFVVSLEMHGRRPSVFHTGLRIVPHNFVGESYQDVLGPILFERQSPK